MPNIRFSHLGAFILAVVCSIPFWAEYAREKGAIKMLATYLLHATAETATSTLAAVIVALVVGVVAGIAMKSKLFN